MSGYRDDPIWKKEAARFAELQREYEQVANGRIARISAMVQVPLVLDRVAANSYRLAVDQSALKDGESFELDTVGRTQGVFTHKLYTVERLGLAIMGIHGTKSGYIERVEVERKRLGLA